MTMQTSALPLFFQQIEQQLEQNPDEIRRLFHGRGCQWEGLEQLTCDWLQGQLVVNVFKAVDDDFLIELKKQLLAFTTNELWQRKNGRTILLQHRYVNGAPSECLYGELESSPVVVENGLKYQLSVGTNQNIGLFLDMRYGRQWVQQHAKDKNVLNLFAYTCGFSVAAIAGGADNVVNVDMAKGSLTKGRENHKLNNHNINQVKFLGHDIFRSWGKIRNSGPYDLIIIDPPSFQKGSFALTTDYKRILRRLPELLTQDGEVLACVNSPTVTCDFLIDGMAKEAPELQYIERLENPPEFTEIDPERGLKVLRFGYRLEESSTMEN